MVLPNERTLRDYRNFFKPKPGFNEANVSQLKEQTSQLFNVQRYVILSFDEMKIQSSLVFDKHSDEIIGFVDLDDDNVNIAAFDSRSVIASHVLAFMIRGVASDLKYILEYFSTENATSYQLMTLFWKAETKVSNDFNFIIKLTLHSGYFWPGRVILKTVVSVQDRNRQRYFLQFYKLYYRNL